MGRTDGTSALVLALDADDALRAAREAFPLRLPPDAAYLSTAQTANAVLAGEPLPGTAHVPVVD